jgi:hypothetical protein
MIPKSYRKDINRPRQVRFDQYDSLELSIEFFTELVFVLVCTLLIIYTHNRSLDIKEGKRQEIEDMKCDIRELKMKLKMKYDDEVV